MPPPTAPDPAPLQLTGERTLPGIGHENYWFRRHEAAYLWAAQLLAPTGAPPVVVDAGSGEGYGAGLLESAVGARVVGLDYDSCALAHAALAYPGAGFLRANLVRWPVASGCVDAVVCLQVVEHLWSVPQLLDEVARALRPGGTVVVSTPNRLTFSPGLRRGGRPTNPFHVRELDAEELAGELAARLAVDAVLGLSHGPRLRDWEDRHGSLVAAQLAAPPAQWDAGLAETVAGVTAQDFVVGAAVGDCLDLLAVAHR